MPPPPFRDAWSLIESRGLNYELRNHDIFVIPTVRIELFRKIPLYALPYEWTNLAEHIRYQHKRITFKITLIDFLFENLI